MDYPYTVQFELRLAKEGNRDGETYIFDGRDGRLSINDKGNLQINRSYFTQDFGYQIPTDSFDQVLIQTYQAAIDNEGKVLGFWETIYDLKQPLKTYLDNSAQALVAWSDATSGASFKEETDF